jgi:hypothetical protein
MENDMSDEQYLTAEGAARLREELNYPFAMSMRPALAKRLRAAVQDGRPL